jgi:DDE superfamily endonuclease
VVAGIVVSLPFVDRPVCLPVLARLWRPRGTPKTVLACQMVAAIAGRLPDRMVHVVADAHYAGADGAPLRDGLRERGVPAGITLTSRLRVNAVLHAIATPIPGRGGRPRRIGKRLGTPTDLARIGGWQQHTVSRYGRTDTVWLAETVCLWYGSYRSRAVRVVLVREPGSTAKAGYHLALITTDLHTPTGDIVARYAARWSIEVAFQDAKQITGVGEARNRTPTAVERTVPFGLITQSIVVLWYTHHGHTPQITEDRRSQAPWYRTKTQPAYLDMIVKLRRTLIAARFLPTSLREPTPQETSRRASGLGRSRRIEAHKSESRVDPLVHEPLLVWFPGIGTIGGQSDRHGGEVRVLLDRRLHTVCNLGPLVGGGTSQEELRL